MNETPILQELGDTAWSVALAVLPLVAFFTVFQLLFLKLPRTEVSRILAGTLTASLGLFLFLLGVTIGFLPVGRAIGEAMGSLPQQWLIVSLGVILGFVTTWGEPAVRILADQVDGIDPAIPGAVRSLLRRRRRGRARNGSNRVWYSVVVAARARLRARACRHMVQR